VEGGEGEGEGGWCRGETTKQKKNTNGVSQASNLARMSSNRSSPSWTFFSVLSISDWSFRAPAMAYDAEAHPKKKPDPRTPP